eukprot:SAG11_NODE_11499_length_756_cov_4.356164_2_plen_84_part_00
MDADGPLAPTDTSRFFQNLPEHGHRVPCGGKLPTSFLTPSAERRLPDGPLTFNLELSYHEPTPTTPGWTPRALCVVLCGLAAT